MRARGDVKRVRASQDLGLGHLASIISGDMNEIPRIASRHLVGCLSSGKLPAKSSVVSPDLSFGGT